MHKTGTEVEATKKTKMRNNVNKLINVNNIY